MSVRGHRPGALLLLAAALATGSVAADERGKSPLPGNGSDPDRAAGYDPCAPQDEKPRRRPGRPPPEASPCPDDGLVPAAWYELPGVTAVPDRWRIVSALGYPERLWDPYSGNNVLKGDRPLFGADWFFSLAMISDSTYESREVPTPVAIATSPQPGALDVIGDPAQTLFTQNFVVETVLYKGETVFKPPDYEFRFLPVFNLTRVEVGEAGFLKVDPTAPLTRSEGFVGIQGLFVDKHLRNVSERYDFDSVRVGIQQVVQQPIEIADREIVHEP